MGFTEPVLLWSSGSFAFGITLTLDLGTLLVAYESFRSTKSFYMAAMCGICIAHMLDITSRFMALLADMSEGVDADGFRRATAVGWDLSGATWALFDGAGLVLLNGFRLWRFCKGVLPRISQLCAGLAALSALVKFIDTIFFWVEIGKRVPIDPVGVAGTILNYWSMGDALINGFISAVFLYRVNDLTKRRDGGPVLREGLTSAIRQSQVMLFVECALMIAANITVQVDPTFDYLWASIFLVESLRLRVICTFLQRLRSIMRAGAGKSGTGSQSQDRSATGGTTSSVQASSGVRLAPLGATSTIKSSPGILAPSTSNLIGASASVSPTSPTAHGGRFA
ncbi:hypothetical protein H9P43_000499 [Blastocladiella emersonii ATCC 22665]|nr:hypothetical protein H9P43_000499 [Blastocladiella emersonii ATCC 22665]